MMLPMSERLNSIDWDTRMGIQAWMYSLTIHAMLVGLALLLGARLMVATPEEPFHWNVALVEHAPVTEAVTPAPPVTPVQPPAKPVQQTPKKVQPAPQPTPVERRIETTVQPIVQQMQTKPQEQILERKIETVNTPQQMEQKTEIRPSTQEPTPVVTPAPSLVEQPTQVIAAGPAPREHIVETPSVQSAAEIVQRAEVSQQPSPVAERTPPPVTETSPAHTVEQMSHAPAVVQNHDAIDHAPELPLVNHSGAPDEHQLVAKAPPTSMPPSRPDYGWLTDMLQRRSAEVRHYPSQARLNQWQGKVVVRAVIRADGHLADVTVKKSSGHSVLDEAAMDVIRRITPIQLKYALGRQEVVVNIPISYELN